MGRIYRNLPAIPVPSNAHINGYDNRVFYEYKRDGVRHKTAVGVIASIEKRTMHANDNFRRLYPDLWTFHYGEAVPPASCIRVGLYGVTLAIGIQTQLYRLVQECFGPQHGNAIMDFAMYSIRERSNTAQLFPLEMKDQMLFSRKPLSDAWFSNLFAHGMTLDQIHKFRIAWLERCVAHGTKKVWLCIDGSNNDCAVKSSDLAQRGNAKSHNDTNIVSYMWAVEAETGRPITWFVNKGGMPDCKAVDEVIRFLTSTGIEVEGFIFDRGFGSQEVLDLVTEKQKNYIVMLKSNTNGFIEMVSRHADEIRWKARHAVSDDGIFGIADSVKVFESSKAPSCTALFFVGMANAARFIKLMGKIRSAARKLSSDITAKVGNPDKIKVPAEMKKYLQLVKATIEDKEKVIDVKIDYEAWQQEADSYGFHAIASSQQRSAEEIHSLYQLRDVSEKQYAALKSQLAGDVTRVHSDESIQSRFAVCFIASIIRTELLLQCQSMKLNINEMLRKLDDVHMTRMTGGVYEAVRSHSADVAALLAKYGIKFEHLQHFAREINEQDVNLNDQERTLPNAEPPRRGRKKGSKNKKTLEREARQKAEAAEAAAAAAAAGLPAPEDLPEKPKRGPGRPKGSKNKKTLARLAAIAAGVIVVPPKRKPGRPKGSKNKKTLERETRAARIAEGRRGPGRPKGSKNKPKTPSSETAN